MTRLHACEGNAILVPFWGGFPEGERHNGHIHASKRKTHKFLNLSVISNIARTASGIESSGFSLADSGDTKQESDFAHCLTGMPRRAPISAVQNEK